MTRQREDQFAKDLLKSILEPLGQVTSGKEVPAEALRIDVAFEGLNPDVEPADLALWGVLGTLLKAPCLFEPYSTPLRDEHLENGMAKLSWSRLEHRRRKGADRTRLSLPELWVLTPTAASERLNLHALTDGPALNLFPENIEPMQRRGLYRLGTAWGLGVIVMDELPECRETLLLRLLGRGITRRKALEQLQSLPLADPLRSPLVHLLVKWRIIYQELPLSSPDDEEVVMLLNTTYQNWVKEMTDKGRVEGLREGRQEGRVEGLRDAILRAWQRRFGSIPQEVSAHLAQISSPEKLEAVMDVVFTANSASEAVSALQQR